MTKDKDAPKPKRGKKRVIVGALAVILVAGAGAGGGLYAARLTGGGDAHAADDTPKLVRKGEGATAATGGEGKSDTPARAPGKQYDAAYYAFQAPFTANLGNSGSFVQLGIAVVTNYDDRVVAAVKANEIALRSAVLLTIADEDAGALATKPGKQALQVKLRDAINHELTTRTGFGGIDAVYFTTLVIQ